MELCVHSGSRSSFRRHHAGALWLRVIAPQYQQQQQAAEWRSERARVEIKSSAAGREVEEAEDGGCPCLALELWEAANNSDADCSDDSDAFLSLIGSAYVDVKTWKQASTSCSMRWYIVQSDRQGKKEAWSTEGGFEEHEEQLLPGGVCIRAELVASSFQATKEEKRETEHEPKADPPPPPSSFPSPSVDNEFQFVVPSQPIAKNRRFLATRVGEIVHEGSAEYLRELLPVVLYGRAQLHSAHAGLAGSNCYSSPANTQAIVQASWTTIRGLRERVSAWELPIVAASPRSNHVLWTHAGTRKVETKQSKLMQHRTKLQATKENLELRRRNLRRELHVLDSSLDAMRLLLQQVDPECLELLQQDM